jgi:hypothetical protein
MGRSDQVPRCASSGRSRTHGHFEVEAGTDEHPGDKAATIRYERFCRMWGLYLAGSETAFRNSPSIREGLY